MNSSISDSEREARPWRRWLLRYAAASIGIALVLAAFILALDPYDTGRFALFPDRGIPHFGQRLTVASAGRSPEIDAAIIGNSTIQLLDPRRIGAASGLRAASLAIPGTGPTEQLAVGRWLLRWHPGTALRAIVMGIDRSWCGGIGDDPPGYPFPFWLYGESRIDYALHMIRLQGLDHAWRKVKLLQGLEKSERDFGYDDYDKGRQWDEAGFRARLEASVAARPRDAGLGARRVREAVPELSRFLRTLSPETAVVLVLPPVYRAWLPKPGSAEAGRLEGCKTELRALADDRPRTALIDYLHDGEIAGRSENFWDAVHYRSTVARRLEAEISEAAARLMTVAATSTDLPAGKPR